MLEIIAAYKTSKGVFLKKDDAEKPKNRTFDARENMHEPVEEVYLLRLTKDGCAPTYFKAKPIKVK